MRLAVLLAVAAALLPWCARRWRARSGGRWLVALYAAVTVTVVGRWLLGGY